MRLSKIEIDLLKLLNSNGILSLTQISLFLKSSTVSSRKYLNNLNKFLIEYKLGFIKNNKKDGYELFFNGDLDSLKSLKPIDDLEAEERQNYLICRVIFEEMITLTSLVEELNINRNTLVGDLKKIKKYLNKFNLKIVSLPWKGIKLEGSHSDIVSFSIQFIVKFFYEKDLNIKIWELYGIFINPQMKTYFDSRLKECDFTKIEKILFNLLKVIKVPIGPYTYAAIKSIFIHQYLKHNSYNNYNFLEYLKKLDLKILEEYNNIYAWLEDNQDVQENLIFKESLKSISFNILVCTNPVLLCEETQTNLITKEILKYIEETYKIKMNEITNNELLILINLIKTLIFKYNFSVYSHRNYHTTESSIPSKIIRDLGSLFKKNNYKFIEEDYYLLAVYIYQIVCEKYSISQKNINILIIGSSFNNWLGKGLKDRLNRYLPYINVEELSIFDILNPVNSIDYDRYNHILFSNYIDKEAFLKEHIDLKNKFYLVLYDDYFNINFFWNLFFNKK